MSLEVRLDSRCSHRARFRAALAATVLVVAAAAFATADEPRPDFDADAGANTDRDFEAALHEAPRDASIIPTRPKLTAPSADPQFGGVRTVQVNVGVDGRNILGDAANEPSLAVDPRHPNRMAIGWRQFDDVLSDFRQAGVGFSNNTGRSWHYANVIDFGIFRSDPVLASDANGQFYYSSLTSSFGNLTVDIFTSSNGGANWTGPFPAFGGDKQWIAIDRTNGIGHGNLYQAWSVASGCCGNSIFTRSTNSAASFWQPIPVPSTPRWGTLAVAPDGTLYIAGVSSGGQFVVAKSTTVKNPVFSPAFDFSTVVNLGGVVRVGNGAGTPNPVGLLGQVWIAVDPLIGPTAGWIYVVCSVDPPGSDPLDVMFARSTDGGLTWSAPKRLNTDTTLGWQWGATMAIAPNGRIDVIWNDTRNTGVPNRSALFYTSSFDGNYWTPNVQVSPEWDSYLGFPSQQKIGDYSQLVSDDVGTSLAWAATFNGEQDVWLTRIGDYDCNGNSVPDSLDIATHTVPDHNSNGIPDTCEGLQATDVVPEPGNWQLAQNAPNPFNPATRIRFAAPPDGGAVRLSIFDVGGRLVRTFRKTAVGGSDAFLWDGTNEHGVAEASGVYVYRLDATGFTAMRRMVLVR